MVIKETHVLLAKAQIKTLADLGMAMTQDEQDILLARAKEKDLNEYHKGIKQQAEFLEANLVAYTLSNPKEVLTVECRTCKEKFQTNYKFQKYCSTECLSTGVLQRGLKWDPEKPLTERWHGLPPTIIQPVTLKQLLVWAKEIVRQSENPDVGHERERPPLLPSDNTLPTPRELLGPPLRDGQEDEI